MCLLLVSMTKTNVQQNTAFTFTNLKECGTSKGTVCTHEYVKMPVCMLIYLESEQMCSSSHPQHPGIKQKEG